jgi:N-acetylmuramoyl-L-alanine amidase
MLKRLYWIIGFTGLLILLSMPAQAAPLQLTNLQVTTQDNSTQVILKFNGSADYHFFTLLHPDRLVIDFPHAQLTASLQGLSLENAPFNKVREGHPKPGVARLVFDLTQPLLPNALKLSRVTVPNGEQLILTLPSDNIRERSAHPDLQVTKNQSAGQVVAQQLPDNKAIALQQAQQWTQENLAQKTTTNIPSQTNTKIITTKNNKPTLNPPADQITAQQLPDNNTEQPNTTSTSSSPPRPIMIVIDPGHGGKDPGTISPNGIREKDVVLAISRKLYQLLQKEPGYRAALTRSGDYFIPLRGRLRIARQDKGDMFIAIHADASHEAGATGAAVFALSQHGATSEAARWLAEKENYSELSGVALSDKSDMLRSVLIDLSQTSTISSSLELGSDLLPQLAKVGRLHYAHVEQAPFMVLKSPDIPSLLVETGFLSNPIEERRLSDPSYQQAIAQALFVGIKNYFWNNPPPDTIIATLKQNKKLS